MSMYVYIVHLPDKTNRNPHFYRVFKLNILNTAKSAFRLNFNRLQQKQPPKLNAYKTKEQVTSTCRKGAGYCSSLQTCSVPVASPGRKTEMPLNPFTILPTSKSLGEQAVPSGEGRTLSEPYESTAFRRRVCAASERAAVSETLRAFCKWGAFGTFVGTKVQGKASLILEQN